MAEKKYKILTIEDESFLRKSTRFFLEDYGYRVLEAENGKKGLDIFFREKPDLVLVDIMMPVMDGITVLKKIHERYPGFPVIVISGTGDIKDVVRALKYGAWDYLIKPMADMTVLLHAVKNSLEKTQLISENKRYQEDLEAQVKDRTQQLQERTIILEETNERLNAEIAEKKRAEAKIRRLNDELELRVLQRTEQLEIANQELVKKERLAVLGRLIATVSHEIRNPLGVIRSSVFFLKKKCSDCHLKADKHLERIDLQVEQCDKIIGDLMEYSRGKKSVPALADISGFLTSVVGRFQKECADEILLVTKMLPGIYEFPFDRYKLDLAVTNLLNNARTAVLEKKEGSSSEYRPQIEVMTQKKEGGLSITILDNGIGMGSRVAENAFDPLFTTKTQGGTGLGLAIAKKIVEEHHGSIWFETTVNSGTSINVYLSVKKKD